MWHSNFGDFSVLAQKFAKKGLNGDKRRNAEWNRVRETASGTQDSSQSRIVFVYLHVYLCWYVRNHRQTGATWKRATLTSLCNGSGQPATQTETDRGWEKRFRRDIDRTMQKCSNFRCTYLGAATWSGNCNTQRCRKIPSHSCTPMIPKIKNTKKHSNNTLPSIGSVSSSSITKIRMPVESCGTKIIQYEPSNQRVGRFNGLMGVDSFLWIGT